MAVYSVGQITAYLKNSLESDYLLQDLWIIGEISNLSKSAAGHFYFTLKDRDTQIRCVMFRPAYGGQDLTNGASVYTHGRISIYEVRGDLQLYVDLVQPEGVGERYLELELLRTRLESEGLFLQSRKRPIPEFPKKIGVITSPFGSVWHDIKNVIQRRFPTIEITLAPVPVQGEGAANAIAQSFDHINAQYDIDLVIIARGGGSLEELSPFNEEIVARAIFGSRAPVISAIGHETDFTIADQVADVRAPTPSAAAELAVPDREELHDKLLYSIRNMSGQIYRSILDRRHQIQQHGLRLRSQVPSIPSWYQRIDELSRNYNRSMEIHMTLQRERVNALKMRLASLDPSAVLDRGFAIIQHTIDNQIVTSTTQVSLHDELTVVVKDGNFHTKVTKT